MINNDYKNDKIMINNNTRGISRSKVFDTDISDARNIVSEDRTSNDPLDLEVGALHGHLHSHLAQLLLGQCVCHIKLLTHK